VVDVGSTLLSIAADSLDPELVAIAGERTRGMRAAIRSLSHQEQTVLSLIYVQEMSGADAGRVIGVTESRVSQILSGARRKLRHHMGRYDAGDSLGIAA